MFVHLKSAWSEKNTLKPIAKSGRYHPNKLKIIKDMIHFGVIQQNWSFDKFNILFILVSFDDEKWVYILLYCKKIKIVLSIFFYSLWLDILNLWHISRSKAEKLFTWMLMSTKFCFFRNVLIFDLSWPINKNEEPNIPFYPHLSP